MNFIFKLTATFTIITWLLSAVLVLGSGLFYYFAIPVHLVVSLIFLLTALYTYFKQKAAFIILHWKDRPTGRLLSMPDLLALRRMQRWEIVSMLISGILGLLVFLMAAHRVFSEHMAVFG